MRHETQVRVLERVLANLDAGVHDSGPESRTDPRVYFDPERLRLEEELFRRHPFIAGHESELPAPGDYLVHDLAGISALVVRDAGGTVRAFHNVCRHRGTRLVAGPRGHAPAFACRYHAWTYGLDGALRHLPQADAFPDLDRAECGLVPIARDVHLGLIWLAPGANGPLRMSERLGEFGADLEAFGLGEQVVFRTNARRRRCNWKLIVEAFLEPYHVRVLHRGSIGRFFVERGTVYDVDGADLRSCVPRHDVRDLLALPRAAWNARTHATTSYFFFPGTIIVVNPDYWSVIRVAPAGTDECVFSHSLLVPRGRDGEADREHWEKSYQLVDQTVFEKEDCEIAESIQSGVRSGANSFFRLGRMEYPIRLFHDALERALTRR